MEFDRIIQGDALGVLKSLPDEIVDCCVTSPPYWGLRDYGHLDQLGRETTPESYVDRLVTIFREVWRVLKPQGTLWLNLGDSYAAAYFPESLKSKDLVGIPWRVAFALQTDGWYLRSDIIWHKPNPMPESVKDRPTRSHEYIFLLSKRGKYFYDAEAILEQATGRPKFDNNGSRARTDASRHDHGRHDSTPAFTRNRRSVWTVATHPYKGAHFATFPPQLIAPCIKAGCPAGGVVLDPFIGSGTTSQVAVELGRHYLGIELNPDYIELAKKRLVVQLPMVI